ncbi:MAG: transposase [Chloroflexi bacterium]|nr:transposase [Chloroflexota bacterium]
MFTTLNDAEALIEQWRREYNQARPHTSFRYQPPVPEAFLTMATR